MSLYSGYWVTPPTQIPGTEGNSRPFLFSAGDPLSNTFMLGGFDSHNRLPLYTYYIDYTWGSPFPFPTHNDNNLFLAYISPGKQGHFMATINNPEQNVVSCYSFFDGTKWSFVDYIDNNDTLIGSLVFSASRQSGEFLVTWSNYNPNTGLYSPYYAMFDENSLSWTMHASPIPGSLPSSSPYLKSTFVSCDHLGNFMVTWAGPDFTPYYSFYKVDNTWTQPIQITNLQLKSPLTACNSSGHFMATFVDASSRIYFAIYDGFSWTEPALINNETHIGFAAVPCARSSGEFMLTWGNYNSSNSTYTPYYAIYKEGIGWTTPPTPIADTTLACPNIYLLPQPCVNCYDDVLVTFFFLDPILGYSSYYALYGDITVQASGEKISVYNLLTRKANKITWQSVEGASSYNIYSDGALKNLVYQGSDLIFIDYQVENQRYFITWVDSQEKESAPTIVNIPAEE